MEADEFDSAVDRMRAAAFKMESAFRQLSTAINVLRIEVIESAEGKYPGCTSLSKRATEVAESAIARAVNGRLPPPG